MPSTYLTAAQDAQLTLVKTRISANINAAGPDNILQIACENFKYAFAQAIEIGGQKGKQSLTTSAKHIQLFHEVVKSEFIKAGVSPDLIYPRRTESSGELNLAGFLKAKKQDITIVPKEFHDNKLPEEIPHGMMAGQQDVFGRVYTENCLVVNVRSQMSSIGNNVDTIAERAFAETLNLHMRCPNMVLGELFVLPITGLDKNSIKNNIPAYEGRITVKKNGKSKTTADSIAKVLNTYSALNNRNINGSEKYKYERLCLILADFSADPVKIYFNDQDLLDDGLLTQNSTASMNGMEFNTFISDLLQIYAARFPNNTFNP